ncbi:GNAT family N-acetyltransferase [Glutamicibacter sp. NPDC087344]|uniref:GNAT family N-acetyltransferase n=1 Tax=Glutamicibacter sp. NPDC087344 TaxID=3363994 RepID=UPI00380C26C2
MRHIHISDYRGHQAVRELLALAADPADEAALQALFDHCQQLQVLVEFSPGNEPIALAAYALHDEYSLRVEYLAVREKFQHQGLGSALMLRLQQEHQRSIWATTDADAVDFYRALGCVVTTSATDPRWPANPRFLCTLPFLPLLSGQPETDPAYEAVDGQLLRGLVKIVPPKPQWPADFTTIHAALSTALGSTALAIEHTGSTSVPGLPAKSLIDVALLVPDADDESSYVPQLRAAGLVFWHREPGWYKHRMFKPSPDAGLADANIHIFSAGSPEFLRMLLFRDHLRTHPADREAYAAIKYRAAAQLAASDADAGLMMDYNRIKEPFILELHQRIFGG